MNNMYNKIYKTEVFSILKTVLKTFTIYKIYIAKTGRKIKSYYYEAVIITEWFLFHLLVSYKSF